MRAAFGKVNTLHNHVLPWIDRPLVTQNLVGGEDGIDDAGLSLSRILPAPKGLFLEGTAQVYRGDSENVFRAHARSDVSTVGHLRIYSDITDQHQYRSRRIVRARPQSVRRWLQSAVRLRCDAAVEAAARARSITRLWRAASSSGRAPACAGCNGTPIRRRSAASATRLRARSGQSFRLLRVRRLPTRTPLVPRRTLRSLAARRVPADESGNDAACTLASSDRQSQLHRVRLLQDTGGQLAADLSGPASSAMIRGQLRRTSYGEGPHRQRISVPVHVLHGRPRSASVLIMKNTSVTRPRSAASL